MLDNFEAALEEYKAGKMVVLVDDENRENEGDLVFAAEHTTSDLVNFMAREGRGLICVPMADADLERLDLNQMVRDNTDPNNTAFTVSVDADRDVTTGISAGDRFQNHCRTCGSAKRAGGSAQTGSYLPASGQTGRRPCTGRTDRRVCGSLHPLRSQALCRYLRDHE